MSSVFDKFRLDGEVVVITGGAGLLGREHAKAVVGAGGVPFLLDISEEALKEAASEIGGNALTRVVDITKREALKEALVWVESEAKAPSVLINNAAFNPKVEDKLGSSKFEDFPVERWSKEFDVGVSGAFLASQVFGTKMAENSKGVILNISSDLGLIAPNQSIYRTPGVAEDEQPKKPVTYSVVKHALIGLTRYLATYWAEKNVRVNAICPGGVFNGQDDAFIQRLGSLIPLGRMAERDEYQAAILFLISDASSYMTGSIISVDGGRTCW